MIKKLFNLFKPKPLIPTNVEPMQKFLIAGIGNIGPEYQNTRHNLGFQALDFYAQKFDLQFEPKRYGDVAIHKYRGRYLLLLKPATFVNLSGNAVRYWLEREKIPVENMLVIVDDLNLPLGTIRIRAKGSHGGHNGLKHICQVLGHCNFARLRFGIGNNFPPGGQVDYVLGEWTEQEWQVVKSKLPEVVEAIHIFVFQGVQQAMNHFNKKISTKNSQKNN